MADNKALTEKSFHRNFRIFAAICLLIIGASLNAGENHENHSQSATEHATSQTDSHEGGHAADLEHAEDHAEGHEENSEFNAGEMIFDHISDAHGWHLWGHTELPLPVIIYNKEKGLSVFSSSKFEHGHASYEGYKIEQGKVVNADPADTSSFYDISITKNVASMLLSLVILLLILFAVRKGYKTRTGKSPKGIQSILEPLIIFLRDEVIKPSIGKGYERFMPLLLTIFFFIFANNLLGLIPFFPGGANVTGNIAITVVLAVIVFIVQHRVAKKDYWKHIFMPDVPKALYPLLIPIELFGVILKPLVLALRLFANITAGHIIILGFFSLIFIFGQMSFGGGLGASVFSMAFALFMSVLELLVAFLQAYVFTLLSALYFGMAVEEHHHEEAH